VKVLIENSTPNPANAQVTGLRDHAAGTDGEKKP
jgi:hypothetical protein